MLKILSLSLLVALTVLLFFVVMLQPKPDTVKPVAAVYSTLAFTPFTPQHPCYKYSIVPCGAWTAETAGLLNGYAVRAKGGEEFYSSFRIGSQIYWTRWPIKLHKGELIWTDGKRLIRARCGNELKLAPPVPPTNPQVDVADSELDGVIVLPAPDFPGVVFTFTLYPVDVQQPNAPMPPLDGFPVAGLPPVFGGGCCGTIPVRTPEGSSWAYLLTAILVLILALGACRLNPFV